MVDFQSRDTRRGPTDGDDDETGEGETGDDEESAEVDTDTEATASEPTEATGAASGSDDIAAGEADSTATAAVDDTAENRDEPATEAESDGSVTEQLDEAAAQSSDSQSAAETQDGEVAAATTQSPDEDAQKEPHGEAQAATSADSPQEAAVQTTDAPPAQTGSHDDTSQEQSVTTALVTVGTATEEGDPTGEAVEAALEATGQTVTARERLRGDYDGIQEAVDRLVGRDDVEVVVTAGGLGVAQSEQTLEAVHPLFEKALPGFEEVYRALLFEQQGAGVISIRATAGIAGGTPVFCLPADPETARVAIDEIIAAEAPSLVADLS